MKTFEFCKPDLQYYCMCSIVSMIEYHVYLKKRRIILHWKIEWNYTNKIEKKINFLNSVGVITADNVYPKLKRNSVQASSKYVGS